MGPEEADFQDPFDQELKKVVLKNFLVGQTSRWILYLLGWNFQVGYRILFLEAYYTPEQKII